jgi:hypothetical protein
MTIPPEARDLNAEDFQKLKDFQDMATNGPNNAAPDVFGPRENGRPGDEPGYGGPLGTFDKAANQAESNQENRDKQLEDFRATFGNDPNNPGGGDTRQSAGFHTPAKNPGAAGSVVDDPRERASDGQPFDKVYKSFDDGGFDMQATWGDDSGYHIVNVTHIPDGEGGSTTYYSTMDTGKFGTTSRTDVVRVDPDGYVHMDIGEEMIDLNPVEITVERNPDSQPGVEGAGHNGNDNCGWNPMIGCTKRSVKIWDATKQPGAHQDNGGGSAGPRLGQEAVTNTGDGTFDSGVSGGGGGGGRPDPCLTAGGCGGPIGDAGGSPGPAS